MAVSHQWFVQWSPPATLFTEIKQNFGHIEPDYGYKWDYSDAPRTSDPVKVSVDSDYGLRTFYNHRVKHRFRNGYNKKYGYNAPDATRSEDDARTRVSGLALWLAMLGVARAQVAADADTPPFTTLYKWKQVDFEFPTPQHRHHALVTGKYVPSNVLPLGLEVWGSRVFLTFPRWRPGVPATLGSVPRAGGVPSPAVKPYPSWEYHRPNNVLNCTGLTSVFRVSADLCGRLWVLDSGQIDVQDNAKQICPPSLLVFDLNTDKMLARYVIPQEYVLQNSLYSALVVDARRHDCSDLHVYMADPWRFGLLVFRQKDMQFWRFTHHLFFPDPIAANFTLHDLNFRWTDGIFGLALTEVKDDLSDRILFFHSLAGHLEFYVSTAALKKQEMVNNSMNEFNIVGERGPLGQASSSAVDRRGVMYFGLVSRDSVGCWDTRKPFQKGALGIVAQNTETLIFPNDIKIDQGSNQILWVISNRLPMFQAKQLDQDEYNYRLLFVSTEEAVRGTVCDPQVSFTPPQEVISGHKTGWWPSIL
ncbi:hypothetical protein JYU34_012640 [Plutella xylostella]|uniref:Protein yellow n=1 Tax=Plutella xylostella TaxID=51655 RepID=A0ABQ7QCA4_PLUXY|nr:hypothetical protein JYU34_012640 [Plutella xylostella]